jgi:hypothetical protein
MPKQTPAITVRKPPPPATIDSFVTGNLGAKDDGKPSTVAPPPDETPKQDQPSTDYGTPQTANRLPSTANDTRSTEHGAPSTDYGRPQAANREPLTVNDTRLTEHGAPSTDYDTPLTVSRKPKADERWDDAHKRATFHLPKDLLKQLEREARRSDQSKSRLVADAIVEHLKRLRSVTPS